MHEYHSQHRVLTIATLPLRVFLAKHVGKHSSGTFHVAFRDPGQILIIRDCPGDSGIVGAYVAEQAILILIVCIYNMLIVYKYTVEQVFSQLPLLSVQPNSVLYMSGSG